MNIHFPQSSFPKHEQERLSALRSYQLLDTPPEPLFDKITLLASKLLNAPVALISFVDEDRVWCKSHFGTEVNQYKREDGFCAFTILDTKPFIITDASTDPRSINHPLVKPNDGVRFYAGLPLTIDGKHNIGTLCIIDYKPRTNLSSFELETLKLLSSMTIDAIESHAKNLKIVELHKALQEKSRQYSSLFDQTGVGVYVASAQTGQFYEVNQRFQKMIGFSAGELEGISFLDLTHPSDLNIQLQKVEQLCSGEIFEYNHQKRFIHKDGSFVWVNVTTTPLWKKDEQPTAHISIVQDINEKKLAEIAIRESEQRWSLALDVSDQGVWDLNIVTNQILLSTRCKEMLGYSEDLISSDMSEWVKLVHPDDIPCLVSARMQTLNGVVKIFENEHRKLTSDGNYKWVHVKGMVVEQDEDGAPTRVVGTYTDISERKKIEADLLKLAHYDSVTGLPNRTLFTDTLNQELRKSKRSNRSSALMLLDLDGFKEVNDSFGHQKGDLLLKIIGERLTNCLRESDFIARLGGDEFTIILSEINQTSDIELLAIKILDSIAELCLLDGDVAHVTASLGIALFHDDSLGGDELLKNSDQAMYRAKRNGKNTYVFFTTDIQKNSQ